MSEHPHKKYTKTIYLKPQKKWAGSDRKPSKSSQASIKDWFVLFNPVLPILLSGLAFSFICCYFFNWKCSASGSVLVCCGLVSEMFYERFGWRKEMPTNHLAHKERFVKDGTMYKCYLISPYPITEKTIISYRPYGKKPNESATKGKLGALAKFIQDDDLKLPPKFIPFYEEDDYDFGCYDIPWPPKPFIQQLKVRNITRTANWAYRRTVERVENYIFWSIIITMILGTIIWGYGPL